MTFAESGLLRFDKPNNGYGFPVMSPVSRPVAGRRREISLACPARGAGPIAVRRRCGTPVVSFTALESGPGSRSAKQRFTLHCARDAESSAIAEVEPARVLGFDQVELPCTPPALQNADFASAGVEMEAQGSPPDKLVRSLQPLVKPGSAPDLCSLMRRRRSIGDTDVHVPRWRLAGM